MWCSLVWCDVVWCSLVWCDVWCVVVCGVCTLFQPNMQSGFFSLLVAAGPYTTCLSRELCLCLLFSYSSSTIPLSLSPLFLLNFRTFPSGATGSLNDIKYSRINKKRYVVVYLCCIRHSLSKDVPKWYQLIMERENLQVTNLSYCFDVAWSIHDISSILSLTFWRRNYFFSF